VETGHERASLWALIQDLGGHGSEGIGFVDDDGGEGWREMEDEGEIGREGQEDMVEGFGDGGDGDGGDGEEAGVGGWRCWWGRG
jgi:hypothetical protein